MVQKWVYSLAVLTGTFILSSNCDVFSADSVKTLQSNTTAVQVKSEDDELDLDLDGGEQDLRNSKIDVNKITVPVEEKKIAPEQSTRPAEQPPMPSPYDVPQDQYLGQQGKYPSLNQSFSPDVQQQRMGPGAPPPNMKSPPQPYDQVEREQREHAPAVEQMKNEQPKQENVQIPAAPVVVEPKIENVKSINFAKNLKDYRSPRLAMLMSLLVPGAGQAYTRNFWKTAVFGVVEAALIGTSIGFTVNGTKKKEKAYAFARQHFNYDSVSQYYQGLKTLTADNGHGSLSDASELVSSLFYLSDSSYAKDVKERTDVYYGAIKDNVFVQGWDDCEPRISEIDTMSITSKIETAHGFYTLTDSSWYQLDLISSTGAVIRSGILGYSPNQENYDDMMGEANVMFRVANYAIYVMLLNHVVSAIDAGISAKAHNDALLGKDSFWQHIGVDQRMVNTGSTTVPALALQVKF